MITIYWSRESIWHNIIVAELSLNGEKVELRADSRDREFVIKQGDRVVVYTELASRSALMRFSATSPLKCMSGEGVDLGIILNEFHYEIEGVNYSIFRPNPFSQRWCSELANFVGVDDRLIVTPLTIGHDLFFCALGFFLWIKRDLSG